MKKASLTNLITIISLLVLCVMSLLAIYATNPESSLLLFEENFNDLDKNKWSQQISECTEDGELYHYATENVENSKIVADGVWQIYPNITKIRRESQTSDKCSSCLNVKNSPFDCVTSLFSAQLQTKNIFRVDSGQMKIRLKIPSERQITFHIGIVSKQNDSKLENFQRFSGLENETHVTDLPELGIFFDEKSIMRSKITDDKFHIYEINWNNKEITLNIDKNTTNKLELQEKSSLNSNDTSVGQPFYLNVGLTIVKEKEENGSNRSRRRFSDGERDQYRNNSKIDGFAEVDYIQLFRILK